jgi:hypothetical protein
MTITSDKFYGNVFSAMAGPQDNTTPSLLPGETFIAMCERFPWLLFVETLRRGGVKAAMEMVKKGSLSVTLESGVRIINFIRWTNVLLLQVSNAVFMPNDNTRAHV